MFCALKIFKQKSLEIIYNIAGNYKSKLVTSDKLQEEFNKLIKQDSTIIKIYAIYEKGGD